MKRLLSGLCLLTLTSVGLAQAPILQGPTTYPVGQAPTQQVPAGYPAMQQSIPLSYYGQPAAQGVGGSPYAQGVGVLPQTPGYAAAPYTQGVAAAPYSMAGNPTADCCVPMKKVCVSEPAIKTISHTCFSKTCAEFCYPKCSCCLASCFGCCGLCPGCDGPYTKYFLIKKVRTEECQTFKCTPTLVPACGGICGR